jgi:hypothetical protein
MNVVLLLTHTSATSEVMPRQLTGELRIRCSCNDDKYTVSVCEQMLMLTVKINSIIINLVLKQGGHYVVKAVIIISDISRPTSITMYAVMAVFRTPDL